MNDVFKEILAVDTGTKWTFRVIAVAFSALCIWMYLFRNGLPEGLAAMTTGAWGAAVATVERAKNKIESLTGKDIDGDGKIGEVADTAVSAIIAPTETVTVAPAPTTNTAIPADEGPI